MVLSRKSSKIIMSANYGSIERGGLSKYVHRFLVEPEPGGVCWVARSAVILVFVLYCMLRIIV